MLKLRYLSLGQPLPNREPVDWRGAWAAGAFLALAYFFVAAPETPKWAQRR